MTDPAGNLGRMTVLEAARRIAAGEITSEALVAACLARIAARENDVGAWTHLDSAAALEQARAAEKAIAVTALLKAEDKLFERCRNAVRPVRRGCAAASAALVEVSDELARAGEARRESRQVYLQTMPLCERWLGLTPLESALRTVE